jgi:hypothetical protein
MIINGDGQFLLGLLLPDNIFVQVGLNLMGFGKRMGLPFCLYSLVIFNDIVAYTDALVTYEYGRARNQLSDIILALVAERTPQSLLSIVSFHATSFQRIVPTQPQSGISITAGIFFSEKIRLSVRNPSNPDHSCR